jgi:hypothetical protein
MIFGNHGIWSSASNCHSKTASGCGSKAAIYENLYMEETRNAHLDAGRPVVSEMAMFQQIGCRLLGNDRTGHFHQGPVQRDFVRFSWDVRHRTPRNLGCIHDFPDVTDAPFLRQFIWHQTRSISAIGMLRQRATQRPLRRTQVFV